MNIRTFVAFLSRNLQYDFPKMRGGSKAVWNFSEKTSVFVASIVPNIIESWVTILVFKTKKYKLWLNSQSLFIFCQTFNLYSEEEFCGKGFSWEVWVFCRCLGRMGVSGRSRALFCSPARCIFSPAPIQWEVRGRPLPGQCHRPLSGPVLRFSSLQARQKTKLRPSRP